ncbi:protein phosphatase 2C domain-containing protein [Arthrobacter sp. NEB 688]|uniref:PP2C family protein-serine/threonine phosphatase n=1 Tax=Arthrobacter sp. NEB 688 TaxID=904039 RepID=UPI0025707AD9|nr:protein phosphatase 2C domain-containing protein [Arthrobacter sp. NEB 688]
MRAGRVLRGSSMLVRSGRATDVGRVREHNEDSVIAASRVFAVADGMGGHAAGEVASRIVVETLGELEEHPPTSPDDVSAALREANRRILETVNADPAKRGMGTTAAGVVVVDTGGREHWVVFNVGDSRVYRLADHRMHQVTRDHSEVRELVDAGLLDPSEVATHPLRNVITRSLGTDPGPRVDTWVLAPTPGERFVICSDGLSNELDDRDIMVLARQYADPQTAADELVGAAVRAGGRDNVSVVVVAVDAGEDDDDADTAPRAGLHRP